MKTKIDYMIELVDQLNDYRDSYYNNNISLISDKEYDDLFDRLQSLEEETGVIFSNSPTQTVGYEVKSELVKTKHSHPMLSLDKTKDVNELINFAGGQDCILSCKMDGLTILLTYDDGKLVKAETRGNGEIGEDITHNARVFENIPLTIPNHHHLEFEGEAIITYEDFEEINKKLPKDKQYKNPRNLASGSVRQLDSNIAKNRHLKFVMWKFPKGLTHYLEGFKFAKDMGFEVVPFFTYTNNSSDKEDIKEVIETLRKRAAEKSYPIDGLVMTYNNIEYGKSLGMTGHHPKHSIAFKFYDEEYETVLTDIEYSYGKTGVLTPVAIFEPVEIDGTEVSRASIHNISILKELDLHIGDRITVYKANEIIPQVKENLSANERADVSDYVNIPSICPICGGSTEIKKENDSEVLICTNPNCRGKLLGKLKHFVSRDAMNIDGMSEATLQFLIDRGWVNSFVDLYKLDKYKDTWKKYDGYGARSVNKLLEAIDKSKHTTLDRFINALSIPLIGKTAGKAVNKYFNDDANLFVEKILSNKQALFCFDFSKIDGFGEKMGKNCFDYFNNNREDLLKLISLMDFEKEEKNETLRDTLKGKVFVITGSLKHFVNRDELKSKIETLGGTVSGSISKKTSYLINNDVTSNSSKNKKAKELGVPIISEEDFMEMIK